jgi:diamine N-acetyltransferase
MLNSKRILLRAIEDSDIPTLYKFRFSEDSYDYFYEFPVTSLESYKKWLQSIVSRTDQFNFAIEEKSSNQVIGTISLLNLDRRNRKGEMGRVFLHKDFRGKGYFSEILECLAEYAFGDLNLHKVYCEVFADNERGVKAYLNGGFTLEGTMREHIYKSGKYKDVMILSIIK